MKKVGIYRIVNLENDKVYIGSSKDIQSRWRKHVQMLNQCQHHSPHLQAAWDKYGRDSFAFEVVEECPFEELKAREIHWIKYYDSGNSELGYNVVTVVEDRFAFKPERKLQDSLDRGGVIYAFNKEGDIVFKGTAFQVEQELGIKRKKLYDALAGKYKLIKGLNFSREPVFDESKFQRNIAKVYKTKKNPTGVKVPKTKPYRYILTTPEGEQIFLHRGSDAINYIPGATKKGINKLVVGERKSYFNYTCTSTKV